jgi:hypothetical protein
MMGAAVCMRLPNRASVSIFWRAGVSNGGFCVGPDLASSVVSASLFLFIFPPSPLLPFTSNHHHCQSPLLPLENLASV